MITKKIFLKIVCFAICISSLMGVYSTSVSANELINESFGYQSKEEGTLLSDAHMEIANKYIRFDKDLNVFTVDTIGLSSALNTESYQKVLAQVDITNKNLESISNVQENIDIKIHSTDGEQIILKQSMARAWGRDAIEFHWNYARIFISAGSLRPALQCGFAIAGIYASEKIVQAACAILGVGSSYINHGIWFDYNYFIGVLCGNFGLQ